MNKRDWYHKKATKPNNPESTEFWAKYKSLKNNETHIIYEKREPYTKLEVDGEDVTDSEEIAQHFNDYFVNSVNTMYSRMKRRLCLQ